MPHPNSVLRDCLSHGDMTSIAALTGVSPQFVSSYCSPEGPASPHATYLAWLHSVNTANRPAAQKLLDDAQVRLDEWETGEKGKESLGELCVAVNRETADLVCARLKELPRRQQREEALEVMAAAQAFVRELDAASGEFPVLTEVKGQRSEVGNLDVARADKSASGQQ